LLFEARSPSLRRFDIRSKKELLVPSALVSHLLAPTPAGVDAALADDVTFRSPFADYAGRRRIARLFAVMPGVFDELAAVRELHGDGERATVLHGRIGAHMADAVLDERCDADGRVREAMLLVRPHAAATEAIERMRTLLAR
jgi:hypothetical protein